MGSILIEAIPQFQNVRLPELFSKLGIRFEVAQRFKQKLITDFVDKLVSETIGANSKLNSTINVIKHCNISLMPYFRLLKLTAALAHLHDGDVDLDYHNNYYNIRKLVSRWMETLTVRVTFTISADRF